MDKVFVANKNGDLVSGIRLDIGLITYLNIVIHDKTYDIRRYARHVQLRLGLGSLDNDPIIKTLARSEMKIMENDEETFQNWQKFFQEKLTGLSDQLNRRSPKWEYLRVEPVNPKLVNPKPVEPVEPKLVDMVEDVLFIILLVLIIFVLGLFFELLFILIGFILVSCFTLVDLVYIIGVVLVIRSIGTIL